jgi:hypothetical protein
MSNFNFKSFLTNDDGIGGMIGQMIVYWGPVIQACSIECGLIVQTILFTIQRGLGGGGK